MRLSGIISGALGGAAGAVKEIGDTNLKLREAEEAAARERAFRREDALWEMDEKLKRLPTLARAEGEAAAIKEGVLRDAKNKAREGYTQGIINERLGGSVIGDESTWTPEQEAVRSQGMKAREEELRQDPSVRQEVGLKMGEITEKDIMTDDRNRDIAALRQQIADTKNEATRQMLEMRLETMLTIAQMKSDDATNKPGAQDRLTTIVNSANSTIANLEENSPGTQATPEQRKAWQDQMQAAIEVRNMAMSGLRDRIKSDSAPAPAPTAAPAPAPAGGKGLVNGAAAPAPAPASDVKLGKRPAGTTDEQYKGMVDTLMAEYRKAAQRAQSGDARAAADVEALTRELKRIGVDPKAQGGDNAGQRDPGPVRVASKAELDKLPKGTRYTAPDGSVRIKQ